MRQFYLAFPIGHTLRGGRMEFARSGPSGVDGRLPSALGGGESRPASEAEGTAVDEAAHEAEVSGSGGLLRFQCWNIPPILDRIVLAGVQKWKVWGEQKWNR